MNGTPAQDACDVVAETEPNDARGNGAPIVLSASGRILEVRGAIESPMFGDQAFDRFSVIVPARTMLHVRVARTSGDSLLEPAVIVSGGSFTAPRIAEGTFIAERDIYVPATGTYEIAIADRRGLLADDPKGDPAFGYALAIETVSYDVETLTFPTDARTLVMSPVGRVWVFETDAPMTARARFATETDLGMERTTAGIDTILVLETDFGATVEESDDVATGYLDSRILRGFGSNERVRLIVDHHRVIGGAVADLEIDLTADVPPIERELEPNDVPALAGPLIYFGETFGHIREGTESRPDVDWYTIDALAGQVVTFHGLVPPNGQVDPGIEVGKVIGDEFVPMYVNLDSSGTSARTDVIFPEAGIHHLVIYDQRNDEPPFVGGALFEYRIFAEFAGIQPVSVLTSTGTLTGTIAPGGRVIRHVVNTRGPTLLALDTTNTTTDQLVPQLRVYGPGAIGLLGDGVRSALAYLPQAGSFIVGVHNSRNGSGGLDYAYEAQATLIPMIAALESEPNDTEGNEHVLQLPSVISAELPQVTDVDRYAVLLDAEVFVDAVVSTGGRDRTVDLYSPGDPVPLATELGGVWNVETATAGVHLIVVTSINTPGPYTLIVRQR